MSRYYLHCSNCRRRMRKFREDREGDRVYYYCPHCGHRCTYMPAHNALAGDWLREVFSEAVREGVLSEAGRVL